MGESSNSSIKEKSIISLSKSADNNAKKNILKDMNKMLQSIHMVKNKAETHNLLEDNLNQHWVGGIKTSHRKRRHTILYPWEQCERWVKKDGKKTLVRAVREYDNIEFQPYAIQFMGAIVTLVIIRFLKMNDILFEMNEHEHEYFDKIDHHFLYGLCDHRFDDSRKKEEEAGDKAEKKEEEKKNKQEADDKAKEREEEENPTEETADEVKANKEKEDQKNKKKKQSDKKEEEEKNKKWFKKPFCNSPLKVLLFAYNAYNFFFSIFQLVNMYTTLDFPVSMWGTYELVGLAFFSSSAFPSIFGVCMSYCKRHAGIYGKCGENIRRRIYKCWNRLCVYYKLPKSFIGYSKHAISDDPDDDDDEDKAFCSCLKSGNDEEETNDDYEAVPDQDLQKENAKIDKENPKNDNDKDNDAQSNTKQRNNTSTPKKTSETKVDSTKGGQGPPKVYYLADNSITIIDHLNVGISFVALMTLSLYTPFFFSHILPMMIIWPQLVILLFLVWLFMTLGIGELFPGVISTIFNMNRQMCDKSSKDIISVNFFIALFIFMLYVTYMQTFYDHAVWLYHGRNYNCIMHDSYFGRHRASRTGLYQVLRHKLSTLNGCMEMINLLF